MTAAGVHKLRIGFLVNPVAGAGGRAALKGSDDAGQIQSLVQSMTWGEGVNAFARGVQFVHRLDRSRAVVVTPPGPMGEDVVKAGTRAGGPVFEIVRLPGWNKTFGTTNREDTVRFVERLVDARIDLLVFVGGDGTAVDVAQALIGRVPMLGVPAGVKMFSPVFAQTPELAALLLQPLGPKFATHEVDVLDLDERSYRDGAWVVAHQTVARVPEGEGLQAGKGGATPTEGEGLEDLASWFWDAARPGVAYVLGSGSTVGAIKTALGGGTPLGVDVWKDGEWLARDASEEELLAVLGEEGPATIVVSPTGTQGAILGRGTAQISPPVIERVGVADVVVVATPSKLLGLRELFVDTGDPDLDRSFPDYVKVRTDALTEKVFPLRRGPAPLRR